MILILQQKYYFQESRKSLLTSSPEKRNWEPPRLLCRKMSGVVGLLFCLVLFGTKPLPSTYLPPRLMRNLPSLHIKADIVVKAFSPH